MLKAVPAADILKTFNSSVCQFSCATVLLNE